ncbi:hypothetical protein DU508_11420 [Pedobacter chinensis]|uniref:Glycosyltransferase n=1 Tax=Pedobacter chinensis TaxID=2282421 RepID=A0A369PUF6_9SPHI|nr:hypothetical protein [Pedobacter chinensis]RDC56213.1 hypothetical protein DU508_11420 [Pedobacter chinensis]
MRIKTIGLVTISHLSSNPRLVKEARALLDSGYQVHIICSQNLKFLSEFDIQIFRSLSGAKIHVINFETSNIKGIINRSLSSFRLKISSILKIALPDMRWLEFSRMLPEMRRMLKSVKADLFIGHTIGALPAIAWAAKFHQSKYAFDAEDFHRGESNEIFFQKKIENLENYFLPDSVYISTASPLITQAYKQLYPNKTIFTINNVFPFDEKYRLGNVHHSIKIVWFSQTLGLNRGLQSFFKHLDHLNTLNFEFHLRGSHSDKTKEILLSLIDKKWHAQIHFYQQCDPISLQKWLYNFDVGLALEQNEPINRNICITNKLFQYLNAGLAILATNTAGQQWVMDQIPDTGKLITQSDPKVREVLNQWAKNPESLTYAKKASLYAAKTKFNWNIEQTKLLRKISDLK